MISSRLLVVALSVSILGAALLTDRPLASLVIGSAVALTAMVVAFVVLLKAQTVAAPISRGD